MLISIANKKILKVFLYMLISFIILLLALGTIIYFSENGRIMLPVKQKEAFQNVNLDDFPPMLYVEGNKILQPSGDVIVLRGLMPPDPVKLHSKNKFNKRFFQKIKDSGANVVRIPVHPENYYYNKDYLWRYLDPAVAWAGELGMYIIIDWHYIGNIENSTGEKMPDIDIKAKEFTIQFWKQVANYFKEVPNVIFEIFNEPAIISSELWVKNAAEIIEIIREQGAKQIIIVGGIDYSKDLSWVKEMPIDKDNIVYASHIYPIHNNWAYYFGDAAEKYPVLITEWGYMDENRSTTNQHYLIGNEQTYGQPFLNYLDEKGIGWVACWFDNSWEPQIFQKDFKSYTNYGAFVMEALKSNE